jgi:hypothetical protein
MKTKEKSDVVVSLYVSGPYIGTYILLAGCSWMEEREATILSYQPFANWHCNNQWSDYGTRFMWEDVCK